MTDDPEKKAAAPAISPDMVEWPPNPELAISIDDPSQPLVLYQERQSARDGITRKYLIAALVGCTYPVLHLLFNPTLWWPIPVFLAVAAVCILIRRRKIARSTDSILELNNEGLLLESSLFIPWSEIAEARVDKSEAKAGRFLAIVPKDVQKTMKNRKRSLQYVDWLAQRSPALADKIYRVLGKSVLAPICIPEANLAVSAESVAEQINLRKEMVTAQQTIRIENKD